MAPSLSQEYLRVYVLTVLRDLTSLGFSRAQIYDALTRGTNEYYELGSQLSEGPIHQDPVSSNLTALRGSV